MFILVIATVVSVSIAYLANKFPDDDELLAIIGASYAVVALVLSAMAYNDFKFELWPFILLYGTVEATGHLSGYRKKKSWGRSFSYWRLVNKLSYITLLVLLVSFIVYVIGRLI